MLEAHSASCRPPHDGSLIAWRILLCAQVAHRLLHDSWRSGLKPDHLLRVLQCTRLLSRDNSLRQRFVSMGAVKVCTTSVHVAEVQVVVSGKAVQWTSGMGVWGILQQCCH